MDPTETQSQTTVEQLVRENQELRAVCSVWVASNEAKDDRIRLLEQRVTRLRRRVVRISKLLGAKSRGRRTDTAHHA